MGLFFWVGFLLFGIFVFSVGVDGKVLVVLFLVVDLEVFRGFW